MLSILNVYLDDFIPHWHNRREYVQYHILVLVTDGRLTYRLNEDTLEAGKGDIMFIPSGTHREAFNHPDVLHQKYAISFIPSDTMNLPLLEQSSPRKIRIQSFDFFKERFAMVYRQYLEKRDYYEIIGNGILMEILGMLHRELTAPPIPRRKLQYAAAIEQHVVKHFRESISLASLSKLIGRSPNYTLSLFKEVIGMTPAEYQHQLRVHAAIEMLQHTDLTVAAIAEHLGYYDASSFYKMFRKRTGVAPSDYKLKDHNDYHL
jgi:AraC-like DNA-binding protein